MIQLCGLWIGKTKNGDTYFSGTLGGNKVMVFKNNYKKSDNHPDYIINLVKNRKHAEAPKKNEFGPIDSDFESMSETDIPF